MKTDIKKQNARRIKIVFMVHTYALGGLEKVVTDLANQLDPNLYRCTIMSFAPMPSVLHPLNVEQVQLVSLNKKAGNDPRLIYRIYQFLRSEEADIVQTHNWGTLLEGFIAARLARVPHIVHAERGTIESKKRNRWIQRWLWKGARQILCVSETHRKQLAEVIAYPLEKIKPIFNGVDSIRFSPQPTLREATRKKLGFDLETLCIGTLGSLRPVKNQALLLAASARILAGHPNRHLVFAGEGPLKKDLAAQAEKLQIASQVHFLGARNDVPALLNAFDLFVLPSLMEGMPNSVLEAMSCGVPVVASAVGGTQEIITSDENGILFPSKDQEALTAALSDLIKNKEKRAALGQAGRQRILARFSLERMIGEYHDLYQWLAADKRS